MQHVKIKGKRSLKNITFKSTKTIKIFNTKFGRRQLLLVYLRDITYNKVMYTDWSKLVIILFQSIQEPY